MNACMPDQTRFNAGPTTGGRESVGPSTSTAAAVAAMPRKTWAAVPAGAEEIGRKDHVRFATVDGAGGGSCAREDSRRRSMMPQETLRSCLSLAQAVTVVARMPEGTPCVGMAAAALGPFIFVCRMEVAG
jgi:hypothetical protein